MTDHSRSPVRGGHQRMPGRGSRATNVLGWDIGGVNLKVARIRQGRIIAARSKPFLVRDAPDQLVTVLRSLGRSMGAGTGTTHAVTMTAELSRVFRTKREGVAFVTHAVTRAFPGASVVVYGVGGHFLPPSAAAGQARQVAAANWSATAEALARRHPNALLVDTGTTTTDIIPIVRGKVAAHGRTDPERLLSRELIYTGAVRTPTEALASEIRLSGQLSATSADGFAVAGDVHLWRRSITPKDYTSPTPDGRPADRRHAGQRLARVVCADREMLPDRAISQIARGLHEAQVARIADAIRLVISRHPSIQLVIVAGLGSFLGRAAAARCGLRVIPLSRYFGRAGSRAAAAVAVGLLLEARRSSER